MNTVFTHGYDVQEITPAAIIDATTPCTSDDDNYCTVGLPFTFTFYGVPYTEVWMDSNGWIDMNQSYGGWYWFAAPGILFALGDLSPIDFITYDNTTYPDRVIFQWEDVPDYDSGGAYNHSGEIIIYENGTIDIINDYHTSDWLMQGVHDGWAGSVIVDEGDGKDWRFTPKMYEPGEEPVFLNVTQSNFVRDIFVDDDFIFAAHFDKLFVFNKSDYSVFANIVTSNRKSVFVDSNYIYIGREGDPRLRVYDRTDLATPFSPVANLTDASSQVSSIHGDGTYVYAASWDGNAYVYNASDLSLLYTLPMATQDDLYSVFADDNYLYVGGGWSDDKLAVYNKSDFSAPLLNLTTPFEVTLTIYADDQYVYAGGLDAGWVYAWFRAWNKSDWSVVYDWNDSDLQGYTWYGNVKSITGDDKLIYFGGRDQWGWESGWIKVLDNTDFSIVKEYALPNYLPDLAIDEGKLYYGTGKDSGPIGVYIIPAASFDVPPVINSIYTNPSAFSVGYNLSCLANVTDENSDLALVNFTITSPSDTVYSLGTGAASGDLWASPNITVNETGAWNCSVFAIDNASLIAANYSLFTTGEPGAIPVGSGEPFYTTDANPQNCSNMQSGDVCQNSWEVFATGPANSVWTLFVEYTPVTYPVSSPGVAETTTGNIDVTIGSAGAPPAQPAGAARSRGGPATTELEFEEETVLINMSEGDLAYYYFKGELHWILLTKLTPEYSYINFASDPSEATLYIDDFVYVDFDEDNWNDIKMTLRRIKSDVAYFEITLRSQPPPAEPAEFVEIVKPEAEAPEEVAAPAVGEEILKPFTLAGPILFVTIIVAIIVAAVAVRLNVKK
jgi:hypothetical protein